MNEKNRPRYQVGNRSIIYLENSSSSERPPRPSKLLLPKVRPKFRQIKIILLTTKKVSLHALKHIVTIYTPEIQPVDDSASKPALPSQSLMASSSLWVLA